MPNIDFSDRGILAEDTKEGAIPVSSGEAIARGALQGVTFGFADELISVLGASGAKLARPDLFEGVSQKELEKEASRIQIIKEQQVKKARPEAYLAGQVIGGAGAGFGLAKAAPKVFAAAPTATGLGGRALQLGKIGAAEGALTGAGIAEGGLPSRAIGAVGGAALGAPAAIVGGEFARGAVRGAGALAGRLAPSPAQVARTPAEEMFATQAFPREELLEVAPAAREIMTEAERRGITLTPAEALEDPALLQQQAILQQQPGQASVRAAQLAEQRQAQQLPQAFEEQMQAISEVPSPDVAGRRLIEAAQVEETRVRQELINRARPLYEKAYKKSIGKNAPILENMRIKDYLKTVRKEFPEYEDLPNNNIQVLNEVKILMDGDINAALGGATQDRNLARLIGRTKRQLLESMDKASPDYAEARSIYAEGAPEIESIVQGRLGRLAQVKTLREPEAPRELIAGSIEQTEEMARRLPSEQIRAGAVGLMQKAREDLRGEAFSGIEKKIFPTPKQRTQYRALLGEDYEPLAQLMDIFKRVGKGQNFLRGSPTEPRQAARRSFAENVANVVNEAATNKANLAIRAMRTITGKTPEIRAAEDIQFYNDMADILLTPRGLEIIEDLAKLKPNIEQARRILRNVQTGAGAAAAIGAGGIMQEGQEPLPSAIGQQDVPDFSRRGQLIQ